MGVEPSFRIKNGETVPGAQFGNGVSPAHQQPTQQPPNHSPYEDCSNCQEDLEEDDLEDHYDDEEVEDEDDINSFE